MRLSIHLFAWAVLVAFAQPVCRGETEVEARPAVESPSPDGQFAFRFADESESVGKTYNLINKQSGEILARVAEAELDPGPSARFSMEVLWRPDSKAFALVATLWKRGSSVTVYRRDGATFREVKLPELLADIPEKAMKGKEFPHVVELSSQSAKQWKKDGSLVMEIESIQDGEGSTITANRTAVLSFEPSGQAKVVKSTIKFAIDSE